MLNQYRISRLQHTEQLCHACLTNIHTTAGYAFADPFFVLRSVDRVGIPAKGVFVFSKVNGLNGLRVDRLEAEERVSVFASFAVPVEVDRAHIREEILGEPVTRLSGLFDERFRHLESVCRENRIDSKCAEQRVAATKGRAC